MAGFLLRDENMSAVGAPHVCFVCDVPGKHLWRERSAYQRHYHGGLQLSSDSMEWWMTRIMGEAK